MIRHICLATGAPIQVVGVLWSINRRISFVALAHAAATATSAAAIVIRDDVMFSIRGVETGAYPGDIRCHSAGRAAGGATATATAQIPVNGAVSPVVTVFWIATFRNGAVGALSKSAAAENR